MIEMTHSWAQPSKNYMAFFRKEQIAHKVFLNLHFILWEPRKDVINKSFLIYKMMMEVGTQIIKIQPPPQQMTMESKISNTLASPTWLHTSFPLTYSSSSWPSFSSSICKVFFHLELHTSCSLCPEWFFLSRFP